MNVSCGPVSLGPVALELNEAGAAVPAGTLKPMNTWAVSVVASSPELPSRGQLPGGGEPAVCDAQTWKLTWTDPMIPFWTAVGVVMKTSQPDMTTASSPAQAQSSAALRVRRVARVRAPDIRT